MPRVLVVDDSNFICAIVQDTLSDKDMEVVTVQTAEEGICFAREWQPDLVLLDIFLPDMDGYRVCTILKDDQGTAGIPIIFITGKTEVNDIVKGFEVGAVDYINKPFNVVELKARVHTHLKNKLMTDSLNELNIKLATALEENRRLAIEDSMTGMYNRRYGLEYLENYRVNAGQEPSVLFMGDVDDFKKINDNYGHHAGDVVLCQLAQIFQEEIGENGLVCRWGGEEILLLLHNCEAEKAIELGRHICKRVWDYPFSFLKPSVHCGITFGMTTFNCTAPIEFSIRLADKALYMGKQQGKNRCILLQPG